MEEIKGVTVCSLGFTEWAYSQEQIERAIELARPHCDLLIVSVHWGTESSHETTATQRRLGPCDHRRGRDVVLGTHTHVYGGVEQYKGKYIVYSLGNFCFGGNRDPRDKNCLIFSRRSTSPPTEPCPTRNQPHSGARLLVRRQERLPALRAHRRPRGEPARSVIGVSQLEPSQVVWMPDGYEVEQGSGDAGGRQPHGTEARRVHRFARRGARRSLNNASAPRTAKTVRGRFFARMAQSAPGNINSKGRAAGGRRCEFTYNLHDSHRWVLTKYWRSGTLSSSVSTRHC